MLGLFAMLLGCAALAAVGSYWSFWEMEHLDTRPKFVAKLYADLFGLLGRDRGEAQVSPKESAAA